MHFSKASPKRRLAVSVFVAASVLLLGASQASADDGSGTFTGSEYPPASTLYTPPITLCATFNASGTDPLVQELAMDGSFHSVSDGTGTATFTGETAYDANPEGTYVAGSGCDDLSERSDVTGEVDISFGQYTCTDMGATYERRGTSVYTVEATGSCDDTTTTGDDMIATTVTFTGTQVPCDPIVGCVTDPNAGSIMAGSYEQTH